jgi:hypothetical protein
VFQSRFKPFLINHSLLPAEAKELSTELDVIESHFRSRRFSAAEAVFEILKLFLRKRSVGPFWMKASARVTSNPLNLDLLNFAEEFQFKKLPGGILKTLVHWQKSEIKLHLIEEVLNPEDLLNYQARGERVVTFHFEKAKCGELVDGKRDSLEFMLHDLVHADLFFGPNHLEQVRFFQHLQNSMGDFAPMLQNDPDFCQRIQYVMSDMNSHPEHMRQSVRASLVDHFKRDMGAETQLLPPLHEKRVNDLVSRLSSSV